MQSVFHRLKIGKINVLDIKVETLSDDVLQLKIGIDLELLGKDGSSKPVLLVHVNVHLSLRIMQSKLVIEKCLTDAVHIELLPGTAVGNLVGMLSKTLNSLLPNVLCPILQVVLELLNVLLGTLNSEMPVGNLGSVHYAPAGPPSFQDGQMLQTLIASLGDTNGNTITQVPAGLSAPVPLTDHTSKLLLSSSLLRPLLELLVKRGQFNADITQQMLSGDIPMTTSELESILPGVSGLPANTPLVIRIKISDTPVISMQNGNLRVTLKAIVEVLTQKDSDQLLVLDVGIKLAAQLNILGTKLHLSVAIEK
ncbi:BPI fold-containing family B member 4-like [Anolis sagrei]|uniref:BPI fold-containing family B member 4-like n=1 Tax=Anolis sagrei TaxID=38937 RepID=UPI0035203CA5